MDIANSTIYNTPISFTQKYADIEHYNKIIDDQEKFRKLMYRMIVEEQAELHNSKNNSNGDEASGFDVQKLIA